MTAHRLASTRRWPLQPLLAAVGPPDGPRPDPFSTAADRPPDPLAWLARWLDMDIAHVRRAAAEGLSDAQADRWAVRAGWHPANIWGWDTWIAAASDPHQVTHLLPEARRIAAAVTGSGRRLRKIDIVTALREAGVVLAHPRASALWQRLRTELAAAGREGVRAA